MMMKTMTAMIGNDDDDNGGGSFEDDHRNDNKMTMAS